MTSLGSKKIMLSAVQPSSQLTLGNYLGAIKNWVHLQKEYDCLFFAVDLHAITLRQEPKLLRKLTYEAIAFYLASGIDPKNALLFVQSHVPEHAELAWVLTCFSYMGELNRMTQFKDKTSKPGENIPTGIFTYPVLMAADILLYQTHLVPVGQDQKQHIELTRDLALRVNHAYQKNIFTIPEPYIPNIGTRIMSLQNPQAKMSKSDPDPHATLYLMDSDAEILKKLKRAVTDSGTEIILSEDKPGIKNLLTIQATLRSETLDQVVNRYAGKQYGHLKVETAELIISTLTPIRHEAQRLLQDLSYLDSLLREGALKARQRAQPTLLQLYEIIGFLPNRNRT